ncbi:hypothetical protein SAMN04487981_101633 [Streptomyces sp. cf386]|uniref:hypothetical protein n=1 Tax=Streptomyces sp. cf386 TaxID=1761904 RepID=UPI00088FFA7C|nr:hypothetical protein [Streptomyces sp. cf386]SDM47238.1 hypothetical protein SAMN04487981_101633 [Streptomyces sp. cf386]
MSTPYERLMAEAIPTGKFGYPPPPSDPHKRPWTPHEQAEHRRIADEAVADWHDPSDRAEQKRHLHLVPTEQSHTDAA